MIRGLGTKKIGAELFEEARNVVLEKNKMVKVNNQEVLRHIGEKRKLLNNILGRRS